MQMTLRVLAAAAAVVSFLNGQEPINYAAERTVRSSGQLERRYPADKAVDGIVSDNSRWVSSDVPAWLEIDVPDRASVHSAHVYSGWGSGAAIRSFHFEAKRGGRFVRVRGSAVKENDKAFVSVDFAQPVVAASIRLVVDESPNDRARIREVMLWSERGVAKGVGASSKSDPGLIRKPLDRDQHLIAVNQVGYVTDGPKRFTCPLTEDGAKFRVVAVGEGADGGDGEVVFEGEIRDGIGDFSALRVEGARDFRIEVEGGDLKPGRSDTFRVATGLLQDQYWQPAVDFMIDCRSVVGTHPSAFGGCAWRDGTYYTFEVPSLVMMLYADEQRIVAMPRQIDWEADKRRVLSPSFKFDAKNPNSAGVMDVVRSYYTELKPPAPSAPDVVKLIHWGLGYHMFRLSTRDPSNDPLGEQIHSQTIEQYVFALHAWPQLERWLDSSFRKRCEDIVFEHWKSVGLLGIDPLWSPDSWMKPVKKGDDYALGAKLHPYKGRHCPGHAILPNVLMHEYAARIGRADASVYLDAAVAQAEWIVRSIDWSDPRATKGQRMSEYKLMPGLIALLKRYPTKAPKGLRDHVRAWAEVVVERADNMWDFRRYDRDGDWTIPKLNEVGNVACFPACAVSAMHALDDGLLRDRLEEVAVAHIDNLFGRNPRMAAAPHKPEMGFPLVERGWPKGHRENVCARLELCRGSLSALPGSEMYSFNPEGKYRHAEGWICYGSAWNASLAVLHLAPRGELPY